MVNVEERYVDAVREWRKFDAADWGRSGKEAINLLNETADALDKMERGTGVAKMAGGSAALAGGLIGGAAVVCAPFTGGTSIVAGASMLGAVLGGCGGLSSAVTDIVQYKISKPRLEECDRKIARFVEATEQFLNIIQSVQAILQEVVPVESKATPEAILRNLKQRFGGQGPDGVDIAKDAFWNVLVTPLAVAMSTVNAGVTTVSTTVAIPVVIQSFTHVSASPTGVRIQSVIASGAMKGLQTTTKLRQGANAIAKSFSAAASALTITFAVVDIVQGAKSFDGRSKVAQILRQRQAELLTARDMLLPLLKGYALE